MSEVGKQADAANVRDRLFVNAERTVLVRIWASGIVEVATRPDSSAIWSPPVYLTEEK